MDEPAFQQSIEHFSIHAVKEKKVVLLVDSVGIHWFKMLTKVFLALKQKWQQIVRQHVQQTV